LHLLFVSRICQFLVLQVMGVFLVKIKYKMCLKCAMRLGMALFHNSCVRTELKYFVECQNGRVMGHMFALLL
jgi:hypothetical protein